MGCILLVASGSSFGEGHTYYPGSSTPYHYGETYSPFPLSPSNCGISRPGPASAISEATPFEPKKIWFCTAVPMILPGEEGCIGPDDVLPDRKYEREYKLTSKNSSIKEFPESAIFVKEHRLGKDVGESGYILPGQAREKVKLLRFRVNGRYTYEMQNPFDGTGLDATVLWFTGELSGDRKQAVLNQLAKKDVDIARIQTIELVGFNAAPLNLKD